MKEPEKNRRSLRRAAAIGAAVAGAALLLAILLPGTGEERGEVPTFAVRRGPLTISVIEPGTIKARDRVVIVNEVEGRTAIIFLVEEGSRVAKGDLLVELDASRLQDEQVDQQILLRNAEAEYIRAREDLAVVRNRSRSEVERAELDLRFARDDLKKYVEGEYPKALKEAESRITVVQEEPRRAVARTGCSCGSSPASRGSRGTYLLVISPGSIWPARSSCAEIASRSSTPGAICPTRCGTCLRQQRRSA
jgi:HlyD family secretion protein